MFQWFARLTRSSRRAPAREDLLNEGLELAMDWGENWLAPIQDRLAKRHASVPRGELDQINATCQAAMKFGHETAYDMVRDGAQTADADGFRAIVQASYPWIDAANAARLFNQSMYYAWKTGGPARSP